MLARDGRGTVGQRAWLEWGVRDWRERQFLMVPSQGLAFLWSFSPNDCVFIDAAALSSDSTLQLQAAWRHIDGLPVDLGALPTSPT